MRNFLLLLCIFTSASVYCQTSNKIVIGTIDSVNSTILNEKRRIWVHVPQGASVYGKQRYPVLYLFDGDAHFYSVVGLMHQMSQVNGNTVTPPMIIVGILNNNRTKDLTPTSISNNANGSGGGEKIFRFIEKELIPHIDSLYPTAPFRTLVGHSLGGLMVVDALIHHTDLFNSYIAIDPSLWWDDQKLLKESAATLQQHNFKGKSLFVGIANTMSEGMDTLRIQSDTSGNTKHIRSILQFTKELKKNPNNNLRWDYKYYNDDNHGSVPLITEYDAFHFIFKDFRFNNQQLLFDPTYNSDSLITAHYKQVSSLLGYTVLPDEGLINGLGYSFLEKNPDKAYHYFNMNIQNYPESGNTYDSMGDYYLQRGEKKKALEYFTKAFKLNGNPESKEKMNTLLKDNK